MKGKATVALGFLALIAVGALLLSLPQCRVSGEWGDFQSSAFTACSAVCVTGLTVVDIAATFSLTGQIVLLVLVEVGCLGLMMCGTFLMIAIGRRLSLASEFSLMNAYGVEQVKGVKSLILWVIGSMLFFELVGAAALWWKLRDPYLSIFYSVMGFCNAGFSILPGSIAAFADDPWVVMTLAFETILGSIGFLVIFNLLTFKFVHRPSGGRGRMSLQSRVVLRFTGYLLAVGFIAFLALEWNGALGGMDLPRKLYVAFYQAVTPRTCGFCLVPTETLKPITRLVYEVLMFIGGAPGSAAAGIKVTTFAVLIYTLLALCRGDRETIIGKRVVPMDIVRESIVIFMALVVLVTLAMGVLLITEDGRGIPTDALFFEACSAITTTGLSMGDTTSSLSFAGRIAIMCAMFAGRLGALSVVLIIGDREAQRHVRYPTEELVVG